LSDIAQFFTEWLSPILQEFWNEWHASRPFPHETYRSLVVSHFQEYIVLTRSCQNIHRPGGLRMPTTTRGLIPPAVQLPGGNGWFGGFEGMRLRLLLIVWVLLFQPVYLVLAEPALVASQGGDVSADTACSLMNAPSIAWIGGWKGHSGPLTNSRIHALIPAFRDLRRKHEDLVVLSCGSMLGPSPVSYRDQGRLPLFLMQRCGVDVMAVGPHDFFAGSAALLERATEAGFPFVCTNLRVDPGKSSPGLDWGKISPVAWVSRGGKNLAHDA